MTMIGIIILAAALFILLVAVVLLYMVLMILPVSPEPRRKIQRTVYGKNWPRIMEMTKIEKGGKKR